jgi:toxin ParE1/3/4
VVDVAFTNAAEADLTDIDAFSVAQFGDEVAELYMRGFTEAFVLLGQFPNAGPALPELSDGLRCLIHSRHRVLYRFMNDTVLIVRVVHHAIEMRRALSGTWQ